MLVVGSWVICDGVVVHNGVVGSVRRASGARSVMRVRRWVAVGDENGDCP